MTEDIFETYKDDVKAMTADRTVPEAEPESDALEDIQQSIEHLQSESAMAQEAVNSDRMGELLTTAKELLQDISIEFADVDPKYQLYKARFDLRKKYNAPVDDVTKALKAGIKAKLDAERKATEKANRIMKAEAEKQAAELKAAQVKALEEAGEKESAKVLEEAPVVAPVIATRVVEKPKETITVTTYGFEVTDPSKIPAKYLEIDMKAILKDVRDAKGRIEIPGGKVTTDNDVRMKGSRGL